MSDSSISKYALLSVSDKNGIEELGRQLQDAGYSLLSTGGTYRTLSEAGLSVTKVSEFTGSPEIMDGRVKTLHPKIHAGILGRRDNDGDCKAVTDLDGGFIDLVVVNLYPFEQNSKKGLSDKDLVEFIDVGGPTMTRAAAKNYHDVFIVTSPQQYESVTAALRKSKQESFALRKQLAGSAFSLLSRYDSLIAAALTEGDEKSTWPETFHQKQALRYGENPHQPASFLIKGGSALGWKQLQGKDLSYNNILDLDVALDIMRSFSSDPKATCFLLKHLAPCGAAQAETSLEALRLAKAGDPRSHFGGIVVLNRSLDRESAEEILSEFVELVVVPALDEGVAALFERKRNIRLIVAESESTSPFELRSAADGFLWQQRDTWGSTPTSLRSELGTEADFAWRVIRFVKSNAILLCQGHQTVGVGVGETSRIDALENAIRKAHLHGHSLEGTICASDAFFPFPDSIERLAEVGVKLVLAPGGAKRDEEVQSRASDLGVNLVFMNERHFRH